MRSEILVPLYPFFQPNLQSSLFHVSRRGIPPVYQGPAQSSQDENADPRPHSIYVNFSPSHSPLRPAILESFCSVGYVTRGKNLTQQEYWKGITQSKFVLSPPGKNPGVSEVSDLRFILPSWKYSWPIICAEAHMGFNGWIHRWARFLLGVPSEVAVFSLRHYHKQSEGS